MSEPAPLPDKRGRLSRLAVLCLLLCWLVPAVYLFWVDEVDRNSPVVAAKVKWSLNEQINHPPIEIEVQDMQKIGDSEFVGTAKAKDGTVYTVTATLKEATLPRRGRILTASGALAVEFPPRPAFGFCASITGSCGIFMLRCSA